MSLTRYSEVSRRYADSLFQLASESSSQQKVLDEIRGLNEAFAKDSEIQNFFASQVVQASDKAQALKATLESASVSEELKSFLLLLGEKNRLSLFDEIVAAFQDIADKNNGVTRGTVRSSYSLSSEERSEIEGIVKKATNQNVILNYIEDSSVIGGLVAEVGSYTFDDSIQAHLKRLKEELNRSAH